MFEERSLRYVVALCLAVALFVPLGNVVLVSPVVQDLLMQTPEDNALHIAEHLRDTTFSGESNTDSLARHARDYQREFGILKIRLYDAGGRITFSTEPGEVGLVNRRPYFSRIIRTGEPHSALVRGETPTLEGEVLRAHVVETYVPVLADGSPVGVFEIYADVTPAVQRVDRLVLSSTVALVIIMASFLAFTLVLARRTGRNMKERRSAQESLRRANEDMERRVMARTAELTEEIAARRASEQALRRSEDFLQTVFQSILDPFCIYDRELRVVRANDAFASLHGRPADELVGLSCRDICRDQGLSCEPCIVQTSFASSDPCALEKQMVLPGGHEAWVEIHTAPVFDPEGRATHVIEYVRDVTSRTLADRERQRLIADLEHLSRTDSLTELPNRRSLMETLEQETVRARRYGSPLSVILADVDFFKDINDRWGHDAGDAVLRQLARAFGGALRKADRLGRYGGDEFLLILPETDPDGARDFAERLRALLAGDGVSPSTRHAPLTMSMGVAGYHAGEVPEQADLIKEADRALYASKHGGRDRVTLAHESPWLFPPEDAETTG